MLPGSVKSARNAAKGLVSSLVYHSGLAGRLRKSSGLVILMFHKVNALDDSLPLTVPPEMFDALIAEIRKHNEIVMLDRDALEDAGKHRGLRFALSFDDGYKDNYDQAFPILRKHDVPATIYVSTDFINGKREFWYEKIIHAIKSTELREIDLSDLGWGIEATGTETDRLGLIYRLNNELKQKTEEERSSVAAEILERSGARQSFRASEMLSWDDIREMNNWGIDIGSHTLSHPILSREPEDRSREEVTASREIIELELGHRITSFAYPNGTRDDFNDTVVKQVEDAGYTTACTTIEGINSGSAPPHLLQRVNIFSDRCADDRGRFSPERFWMAIALAWYRSR